MGEELGLEVFVVGMMLYHTRIFRGVSSPLVFPDISCLGQVWC